MSVTAEERRKLELLLDQLQEQGECGINEAPEYFSSEESSAWGSGVCHAVSKIREFLEANSKKA
jgi:hypothetical protein